MIVVRSPSAQQLKAIAPAGSGKTTAMRALATAWAKDNIQVNAVLPGWMWGPNVEIYCAFEAHRRDITPEAVREEIAAAIPLGRVPTDAECAGAVLFMLSDLASAVTGQALDVNGGQFYG